MLEPESRVVLMDQLRPPVGYTLEAAVGTTFTLDLRSALVAPLALASIDARASGDPMALLQSVRSCADRVDVFCQAGQIVVPHGHSDLMAFLEPMVHEATPVTPGHLFHPKVWFLKFTSETEPVRFRLVCSSRNLVESNAWDATVQLDGTESDGPLGENAALVAFLEHLPGRAMRGLPRLRAQRVAALARDAARVRWEAPGPFQGVAFHAWGVPGASSDVHFRGTRQAVVAPFVDVEGLQHVAPNKADRYLVSRPEALAALPPEVLPPNTASPLRTLQLDPLAAWVPDEAQSDGTSVPRIERSGLHAKIFVVERNNREAHVFIGSPNATRAAFHGNVEFAVELVGRAHSVGVKSLLGEESGLRKVLQEFSHPGQVTQPDDEAERDLRNVLRSAASRRFTLRVADEGKGYLLHLASHTPLRLPDGFVAHAALLTSRSQMRAVGEDVAATFGPVGLADVSPFVVLTVTDPRGTALSSVVIAELHGDPPGRLDAVISRQVDTPEKFLRLLQLILALGDGYESADDLVGDQTGLGTWGGGGIGEPALLESLVRALAGNPRGVDALEDLVDRLKRTEAGRRVLPAGFSELWENVTRARAATKDRHDQI